MVLKDGQRMWVMVDQVWIHGCDVTGESLTYRMEPGVRREGRQVLYSLQMLQHLFYDISLILVPLDCEQIGGRHS